MRILLTLVSLVLAAQLVGAQSRPDFTGTWRLDPSRSESAHQGQSAPPERLVILQTPEELRIETHHQQQTQVVTYPTDGSERIGRTGDTAVKSRMRWDGPRLVTDAVYTISGVPVTTSQVRILSADGREMTVESSVRVEHGYQWNFSTGNPPHYSQGKDVYLRVP